jgi:hypothetical protein
MFLLQFWSVKGAANLQAVFRVLGLLLPESLNTFSAAKYSKQHHIAPHDDRAYTQVMLVWSTSIVQLG